MSDIQKTQVLSSTNKAGLMIIFTKSAAPK